MTTYMYSKKMRSRELVGQPLVHLYCRLTIAISTVLFLLWSEILCHDPKVLQHMDACLKQFYSSIIPYNSMDLINDFCGEGPHLAK